MLEPPLSAAEALPAALKKEASGTRARFGGNDTAGDPEGGFDGADKYVAQQGYQGRAGQEGAQAGGLQTNATPAGGARRNRAGEEEEEEAVPAGGRPSRLINLMSCIGPRDSPLYFFSSSAPSLPSSATRPSFSPPPSSYDPPPASTPSFPMMLALQKTLAVLVAVTSILALITSVPGAQAEGTDKVLFCLVHPLHSYFSHVD
ncbi:uncharacterized protein LOC134767114 [Penaeus indicus]|uniref:uncharacterized protein LOC134767114 n=1 Tax=Penaeus indicus TaxID=29960 RepID=UPI00300CA269